MAPVFLSGRLRIATVLFIGLVPLLQACSDNGSASVADLANPPEEADNPGMDPVVDPVVGQGGTENTARYRVVFESSWSSTTHALNFPGGPHFSGLVGAVHNEQVIFWELGQLASDGIEVMAETGSKASLRTEVDFAMAAGHALSLVDGSGIGNSPGSVEIEFDVNQEYPQVTVVSMLAPSPDWFVGVHNLDLRDGDGFTDSLTVDLALYDAGTDSGPRYGSSNDDTDPPETITLLTSESTDTPFIDGKPVVGQFIFTKLSE